MRHNDLASLTLLSGTHSDELNREHIESRHSPDRQIFVRDAQGKPLVFSLPTGQIGVFPLKRESKNLPLC